MSDRDSITRIGVSLPGNLLTTFDRLIAEKGYTTRSEAIRDIIREYIHENYLGEKKDREGFSLIAFIYNHHVSQTAEDLLELQHEFYRNIITSQHIHLDRDQCLEIIISRGKYRDNHELASRIHAIKGVFLVKIIDLQELKL